ncbi:hypothetical protein HIM_11361 [Hirsutella minnesotensis 3608]|uniref:Uncharacterized protein n=1 Tax=Hirsutella minnesotensis 3608 TaxID=1043627 RepID=A0A0F7ZR98_9HYPO|nr:hypothetical protein HIM_11361 [Hirsutella minnesotensis 3608]
MASQSTQELKCNQLFDVPHVTAVLTGGGSGIGLMITQALIANGARVYVVDRRKDALDTVTRLYDTGPGEMRTQELSPYCTLGCYPADGSLAGSDLVGLD